MPRQDGVFKNSAIDNEDIHGYHSAMKAKPKKRPGVLVRMYPQDIANLNRVCAERCTPRENYMRRCVLAQVNADLAAIDKHLSRSKK